MSELEKLTEIFRKLGARDPESWAHSQIREGINQLGRYVFLRQAWLQIIDENDSSWMEAEIRAAQAHPNAPFAGVGHALSRLNELGADARDINDVVRGKQAELLFALCSLLDDPGDLPDEVQGMSWSLVQIDEGGKLIAPIQALHESVLDTDPSGREMRPKSIGDN
jgi:hypothetical protein